MQTPTPSPAARGRPSHDVRDRRVMGGLGSAGESTSSFKFMIMKFKLNPSLYWHGK